MTMQLGHVIDMLPQSQLVLYRPSVGALVKGFRQSAGAGTLGTSFFANVQPTKPAELAKIEGGENVEEAVTIYTKTELRMADDEQGLEADRVEYRNKNYKVMSAADWSGQGFRIFIAGLVKQ